jgi:hypothetical protein
VDGRPPHGGYPFAAKEAPMSTSVNTPSQKANAWIEDNLDKLFKYASYRFRFMRPDQKEECIAEMLALTLAAAVSAARRGKLRRLSPHWAVVYAAKRISCGRYIAGSSSRCVMSRATQRKHDFRVVSLDGDWAEDDRRRLQCTEALADSDAEDPFDVVRRGHDYPAIFEAEQVSDKAKATFQFLAETKSEGRQLDLADELNVSPPRITQLKGELTKALAGHDYHGPLGRRPQAN